MNGKLQFKTSYETFGVAVFMEVKYCFASLLNKARRTVTLFDLDDTLLPLKLS